MADRPKIVPPWRRRDSGVRASRESGENGEEITAGDGFVPVRPRAPAGPSAAPAPVAARERGGDNFGAPADGRVLAPAAREPMGRRIIVTALLSVFVAVTVTVVTCLSPLFAVYDFRVEGNQFYDTDQIIINSGLRAGQNGFLALKGGNILRIVALRCSAAEDAIAAACPYIKNVQARYVPPDAIHIKIAERSKSFVIPYQGSGLLIDGEGVVVDITGDYIRAGLPVTTGISVSGYEIGGPADVDDSLKMENALLVINALKQVDRESEEPLSGRVDGIDVSDPRDVILRISGGIDVRLGDGTDLYYRVSAVKEIITHGISEGETGVIVFTNGARPVFKPGMI